MIAARSESLPSVGRHRLAPTASRISTGSDADLSTLGQVLGLALAEAAGDLTPRR